jgi:peptidoglycan DL-endopeptidase LytE
LIREAHIKKLYFSVAAIIVTLLFSGSIYADTYVIKKGDTPRTIAKKFNVSTIDIIKTNNIKPRYLKPGTKITIPSNKKSKTKKTELTQNKGKEAVQCSTKSANLPDNSRYHKVKQGDTLLSLSKKYSISVKNLKKMNNLKSAKIIEGQKLFINQIAPISSYKVKKGDNLWIIAKRFNMSVEELKVLNSLKTKTLKPGQKIFLTHDVDTDKTNNNETILSQNALNEELEKADESGETSETGMKDRLIIFAKKLINIPYRFGGSSLMGIDCSAYVQKVYRLVGINLPRSARAQFKEGDPVDSDELSIGDLVFFRTYASFPSHVGIYMGNNLFIHASSRERKVTIDNLKTPYYLKRFIGAKRLISRKYEKQESTEEG